MIKKIIFIVLLVIALAVVWSIYESIRTNQEQSNVNFFQTDFVTTISEQVTRGLTLGNETSPPEFSLEALGEFSPVAGLVTITQESDSLSSDDAVSEYIEIRADINNAEPINISNWSIQSLVTDVWYGIPQGTEVYTAGAVNEVHDIYLAPGERALIATRPSPVGVSFRTNRCSGFLAETQTFTPDISTQCIDARAVLPPTIENIQAYGDACVALAESFPACTYLTQDTADFSTLTTACREYLQPRLTYNYCARTYDKGDDFFAPREWRIFLESTEPLWKDQYEVIRLLDERNRTVDVFSY